MRRFYPILILCVCFALLVSSCKEQDYELFLCDVENVKDSNYITDGVSFSQIGSRSSEDAHKGNYSAKLSASNRYGPLIVLDDIGPGDRIVYSVFRKAHSDSTKSGIQVHHLDAKHVEKFNREIEKEGVWKNLRIDYVVPNEIKTGRCAIYPYHFSGDGASFYDDIRIEVYKNGIREVALTNIDFSPATLNLFFKTTDYSAIKSKRKEAIETGLLFASKEDLRPAHLKIDNKQYKVAARLKGDLLDHLRGDKWSFRLMLSDQDKWRGMQTFSVHNSKARSHISEWVMHELFRREGIITPQYDFCSLKLNDRKLGVYAYEQHFDNALLTANGRPIAPILKHNDEGYWHNVSKNLSPFQWTAASHIELFNKENDDPAFMDLFNTAQSLLEDVNQGRKNIDQVFDLEKMAVYYALLNLSHANHAQQFTNIRFYMNPYTGLLEPIGFDCFGDHLPKVNSDWRSMGEAVTDRKEFLHHRKLSSHYEDLFFADKYFFRLFLKETQRLSSEAYLKQAESDLQAEIKARETFIRMDEEYKKYTFDWETLFKKAKFTAQKLNPLPEFSVKVFNQDSRRDLLIQSAHYFPMELVGYVSDRDTHWVQEPIYIPGYNLEHDHEFVTVKSPVKTREVLVRTLGLSELFPYPVLKQAAPIPDVPLLSSVSAQAVERLNFLETIDGHLHFVGNDIVLDEVLLVREEYKSIQINSGTTIYFKKNGAIISKVPIIAQGSKQNPIRFISESSVKNGLLVSGSMYESIFSNCVFSGLSGLQAGQFMSRAMVTAYEAPLSFKDCVFINSMGHAAVHSIRSGLTIENGTFSKIFENGIVLEFSKAVLNNLSFDFVAKHSISTHASSTSLRDYTASEIGGTSIRLRGISDCRIERATMENVETGIALSDGARLKAYEVDIDGADVAFKVTSQSQEKSTADIYSKGIENVKIQYILDKSSVLKINNRNKKPM